MECTYSLNQGLDRSSSGLRKITHAVIKSGSFSRKSDGLMLQRYYCKTCSRSFSSETLSSFKYQKKRYLNDVIFSLFASGVSQRRMANLLQVNSKTIVRKFILLGQISLQDMLDRKHLPERKITAFCFDEVETFEHSKLKPLSICLAVEDKTRVILDFTVSNMKAKGHLSKKALKKYGIRKDDRPNNLITLLKNLTTITSPHPLIKSDMNPHYTNPVKKIFKDGVHEVTKGIRGCVTGQGELKAIGFDPLFSLNHTAAMLRANINRLFRKTWNTTKKSERLKYHLAIYVFYHNFRLIKNNT